MIYDLIKLTMEKNENFEIFEKTPKKMRINEEKERTEFDCWKNILIFSNMRMR